uniref:1-acyl-sn-glycerol-3-phosphate acyltransferase delta-like n=1 Tax=Ciona intestinalis TaxID=7719 RepID=UPI000EF53B5F|nr:1-acyl-sn-glycerol-3-phosphate acyltransferase delta-like [Ciona intestinalis]|eukprot:XP_018670071.2 1-acyl-sn-glycerol-3-phosphate acyltransferase delta-like [Ciona intestinalis]
MGFKRSVCGKFLLAYVFITTGMAVNVLQLMTSPLGWLGLRHQKREIVAKLTYLHWILIPAIAQWWSDIEVSVTSHPDDAAKFGKENAIVLLNHKCQLDWVITWVVANCFGVMQQIKAVAKKSLMYIPIVGWAFWFNDFVLIRRNLEADRPIFKKSFELFSSITSKFWLLTFLEGTRFTTEKHRLGVKYALENGLEPLKHHLVPRTKGFALMTQGLRDTVPAVYDATLCFRDQQNPTLVDYVSGGSYHADIIIRRIPMECIPADELACSEFVHNVFKEKDDFVEFHQKNNAFPINTTILEGYVTKKLHKSRIAFYVGLAWSFLQIVPLLYFILLGLFTGTWLQIIFTVTIIATKSVSGRPLLSTSSSVGKRTTSQTNRRTFMTSLPSRNVLLFLILLAALVTATIVIVIVMTSSEHPMSSSLTNDECEVFKTVPIDSTANGHVSCSGTLQVSEGCVSETVGAWTVFYNVSQDWNRSLTYIPKEIHSFSSIVVSPPYKLSPQVCSLQLSCSFASASKLRAFLVDGNVTKPIVMSEDQCHYGYTEDMQFLSSHSSLRVIVVSNSKIELGGSSATVGFKRPGA